MLIKGATDISSITQVLGGKRLMKGLVFVALERRDCHLGLEAR